MSMPMIVPVLRHLKTQLSSIRKADGYYYDVTADQVLDVKRDLTSDGSAIGPNCALYVTGWEKRQTGDEANYGQVLAVVGMALDFAVQVQTDSVEELMQAAADFERAVKKDYSQGGTCKNTTSPTLLIFELDPSGWFFASLKFDCLVPWGENDPSAEFSTTYN